MTRCVRLAAASPRMPKIDSGTSGSAVTRSFTTNPTSSAAAIASRPSVRASSHPYSGAFTKPETSAISPDVARTVPSTSKPRRISLR